MLEVFLSLAFFPTKCLIHCILSGSVSPIDDLLLLIFVYQLYIYHVVLLPPGVIGVDEAIRLDL